MNDVREALAVVLPVRGIAGGKSRLAPVLDAGERAAFNAWLLRHTLDVLRAWRGTENCVVVSACDDAIGIAAAFGAHCVREPPGAGLNAAAALGAAHASSLGRASLLVLPSDLPQLTAGALDALVCESRGADVLIAPDESGAGTNALLVAAHSRLEFRFGPKSFESHCRAAAALGLRVVVHRSPPFAFDVDTPDDYARWRTLSAATPVI
jgi:2-phospho-L-lactate guanylyltransferase